jgi:hypothetical protein
VTDSAGLSSTRTIHCTTSSAHRKAQLVLTLPTSKFFAAGSATLTPWARYYLHWRIRRLLRNDVASVRAVGQVAPGSGAADQNLALARAQAVLAILQLRVGANAATRPRRAHNTKLHYVVELTRASIRQAALPGYGPAVRLLVTYAPA